MSAPMGGRPVVFGEVLFDRFPDGTAVLGGAPFNVAWNLQALGRPPLFISRVGPDVLGGEIRDRMNDWGMDTSMLEADGSRPTGTVEVSIEDGEPRYDIVPDRAFDFIELGELDTITDAALIYHGSLAMRNPEARASFARLVERVQVPRFIDVNLRAPWWSAGQIIALIEGASWIKLNENELQAFAPNNGASERAAEKLRRRFGFDAVILTRGARGAVFVAKDGASSVEPVATSNEVDTVGAGDAFASVVLLGLLEGWPVATTLTRAQEFASGVVSLRGATSDDRHFYARYVNAWSS